MRTSTRDWQRQQNFSHSHWFSGISHCEQRYLAVPVPVLIVNNVAPCTCPGNVPLVTSTKIPNSCFLRAKDSECHIIPCSDLRTIAGWGGDSRAQREPGREWCGI